MNVGFSVLLMYWLRSRAGRPVRMRADTSLSTTPRPGHLITKLLPVSTSLSQAALP